MYPLSGDTGYVRNTWYVAALREEVTREPIERTICDRPMVFYRTEAGDPVAMYGLCPHRYYPLARGRLVGDAIQCGYHGFTFDRSGKCIRIPAQGDKGAGFVQRIYPVVEHGPWLWIWPGDPALADAASLPDTTIFGYSPSGKALPNWTTHAGAPKHLQARIQLIIDNLMDLTHVAFLHGATVDDESLLRGTVTIEEMGNGGLSVVRQVSGASWNSFFDLSFGPENRFPGTCDYVAPGYFFGPGLIVTSGFEITRIDDYEGVPPAFGKSKFLHAITPETAHSAHYFWGCTVKAHTFVPGLQEATIRMTADVIDEDIVAVNAMEPRIDFAASMQRELVARSDLAAIRVRQRIQKLIDEESGSAAHATSAHSQSLPSNR